MPTLVSLFISFSVNTNARKGNIVGGRFGLIENAPGTVCNLYDGWVYQNEYGMMNMLKINI